MVPIGTQLTTYEDILPTSKIVCRLAARSWSVVNQKTHRRAEQLFILQRIRSSISVQAHAFQHIRSSTIGEMSMLIIDAGHVFDIIPFGLPNTQYLEPPSVSISLHLRDCTTNDASAPGHQKGVAIEFPQATLIPELEATT